MERRQVVLLMILNTLLFSYGSVAGTHISPPSSATQSVAAPSSENRIDFDPGLVAAVDSAQFNGMAEFNAVAEFARQVSGFQHESGGDLIIADDEPGYLPRVGSRQHDLITRSANPAGVIFGENSTLIIITLGFAALLLKRRRIKFATAANSPSSGAGKNADVSNAPVIEGSIGSPQRRHFAVDDRPFGASVSDRHEAGNTAGTPQPINTPANRSDRNPYPELAQSVQKLEALAREMAHFQ